MSALGGFLAVTKLLTEYGASTVAPNKVFKISYIGLLLLGLLAKIARASCVMTMCSTLPLPVVHNVLGLLSILILNHSTLEPFTFTIIPERRSSEKNIFQDHRFPRGSLQAL